jgi:RNA polymerase sigma factor (sigma-70 family)
MSEMADFSEVYQREGEAILIFLTRRTLDVEVALDLTAETFAVALQRWSRVRSLAPEQARAWLFTVARRRHARYLRTARLQRRAVVRLGIQVPVVYEEDWNEIEERAGVATLRSVVRQELAELGPAQREAVRLRVLEERRYDEIAQVLGVSEQTARARVSRGLRTLAVAVQPHLQAEKELL